MTETTKARKQNRSASVVLVEQQRMKFAYRDKSSKERLVDFVSSFPKSFGFAAFASTAILIMGCSIPPSYSGLDWKSYVTMELTVIALVLMLNNQPPDLVMLFVTTILTLFKIISVNDAIDGMSSSSVLAIGVLFVVAKGLEEVGTVELLLGSALGQPKSLSIAILRLSLPVAVVSAFMNNTPVVAMMIPVVEGWSMRTGHPSSKLLMPLSFASMLGGMCTLLGTSTNLIMQGQAEDDYKISMFTMTPVGAPLMGIGILIMCVLHPLLPDNGDGSSDDASSTGGAKYPYLCRFECNDAAVGKTLQTTGMAATPGAQCVKVTGPSGDVSELKDVNNNAELEAGTVLEFSCTADAIPLLRKYREMLFDQESNCALLGKGRRHRKLFEVVLDSGSPLIGADPADVDTCIGLYNGVVIGHRAMKRGLRRPTESSFDSTLESVRTPMPAMPVSRVDETEDAPATAEAGAVGATKTVEMDVGDMVVLESFPAFHSTYRASNHFAVVRPVRGGPPRFTTPKDKMRVVASSLVLAAMVALSAADVYKIFVTSLAASIILIASQCLTIEQAFEAIKGRVVLAIVSTYGLGSALDNTGVAKLIADGLVKLGKATGNIGLLCVLYLTTSVLSCVISNQATVILLWPVVEAIEIDGLSIGQFAIVLMMGASTAFSTPIGYQTNLMVYGPGGYSFSDFMKMGGAVTAALTVATGVLTYYLV